MPITETCRACGQRISIPESRIGDGKAILCPICGAAAFALVSSQTDSVAKGDASAQWFYTKEGKGKIGPFSPTELRARAKSGELASTDMVWKQGMAQWRAAGTIKGLFTSLDSAPPARKLAPNPVTPPPVSAAQSRTVLAVPEYPIRYSCPSCHASLESPSRLGGTKLNCPRCGQRLQIPAASSSPASPLTESVRILDDVPPSSPKFSARVQPEEAVLLAKADQPHTNQTPAFPFDNRYQVSLPPAAGGTGMAVSGMVLGIVGFVFSFIPCVGWFLGVLLGVLGAIFSLIGLASSARSGQGKGMALAGLILSILAILWIPIFWLVILGSLSSGLRDASRPKVTEAPPGIFDFKKEESPFPKFEEKKEAEPTSVATKGKVKKVLDELAAQEKKPANVVDQQKKKVKKSESSYGDLKTAFPVNAKDGKYEKKSIGVGEASPGAKPLPAHVRSAWEEAGFESVFVESTELAAPRFFALWGSQPSYTPPGYKKVPGFRWNPPYIDRPRTTLPGGILPKLPVPEEPFVLYLSESGITDVRLKELARFKQLLLLDLSRNNVTDAGLKELAVLTQLKVLNLEETKVTDFGLRELGSLKLHYLRFPREAHTAVGLKNWLSVVEPPTALDIGYRWTPGGQYSNWRLIKPALKDLPGLSRVEWLNLGKVAISDVGLTGLEELQELRTLRLDETKVTDIGLKELRGLRKLEWLDLSSTQVTNAGLKNLAGLHKLQWLDVSGTQITNAGLKELAGLQQLRTLCIGYTKVTDAGLEDLAALKQLRTLYIGNSGLIVGEGARALQKALPGLEIHAARPEPHLGH